MDKITSWHKKTFPNATFDSQLSKLREELEEYQDSKSIEELADIYIVSVVLQERFDSIIGVLMLSALDVKFSDEEIIQAIKNKMKINKKRKWVFVGGVYRHKE